MRRLLMALLAAVALVACMAPAWAQSPYEVRAYAGGLTADTDYHLYDLAKIRAKYVCPYCGYSSYEPGDCPDPFEASGHPATVALIQVPLARRAERIVDIALQDMNADVADYLYHNADNDEIGRAVLGKVFHPENSSRTTESTLYLESSNLVDASTTDNITSTSHLRYFVMSPGVTRPAAMQMYPTLEPAASPSPTVGVNPYRVDNGDVWFVKFEYWTTGVAPLIEHHLSCYMYSRLYGLDLSVEGDDADIADADTEITFLSNSGAIAFRLTPSNYANGTTYTYRFEIASNCQTIPGQEDMSEITEGTLPANSRDAWLTPTDGVITSLSDVAETGMPPHLTYLLAANQFGVGMAAVQYAGDADTSGDVETDNNHRYYNDGEWQYDWTTEVTNADVANSNNNFTSTAPSAPYVRYIGECRFMSSRVDAQPGGGTYPNVAVGAVPYGPGANTPAREINVANRAAEDVVTRRCPFCGNTTIDDVCALHTTANTTASLRRSFLTGLGMWRELMVVTHDETDSDLHFTRSMVSEDALKPHDAGARIGAEVDGTQAFHLEMPAYQAPSIPAVDLAHGWINDQANDDSYQGGLMVFANLGQDEVVDFDNSRNALSENWDVFYRCPDCGVLMTDPSNHPANGCTGHTYCPITGIEYPYGDTECQFSGATLETFAYSDSEYAEYLEHTLQSEEYDITNLAVSVLRKAEMRARNEGVPLGRIEPGVTINRPDTNIQGLLNGVTASPSNISPYASVVEAYEDAANPTVPAAANVGIANGGNVYAPIRMGSLFDPATGLHDGALPYFSRVDLPAYDYSFGRIGQSTPLTHQTIAGYGIDSSNALSSEFSLLPASTFASGGKPYNARLTAGYTARPVPLGQPVGTYVGQTLMYLDTDGDGALDFDHWNAAAGDDTDTSVDEFDPLVDRPLEPVFDRVTGEARVFGSRIPQNDYLSMDTSPTATVRSGADVQVIWLGNRPSAAGAAIDTACPPGDGSSDIPSSSAPINLLYATANYNDAMDDDDPLYRGYQWAMANATELEDAHNITADATDGTVNMSPWALGTGANRWLFWQRRLRHPGGVESTLRFDATSSQGWNGSDNTEWLYGSGLPKENLRSFVDNDGELWLFWHTGDQGKEHLMYRWDFTPGTNDNNEGPVPVTNRAPQEWRADTFATIDPRDVTATVGLKKPSSSPFVYEKDPSAYLGPTGMVNLFFSGYTRSEGQADICWERFDPAGMDGKDAAYPNYGKLAFRKTSAEQGPYIYTANGTWAQMPEELRPNGMRQVFASRHLDWICHDNGSGDNFAVSPAGPDPANITLDDTDADYIWNQNFIDPTFCIALTYDDPNDGARPAAHLYYVTWDRGEYYRARGIYRVTPKLIPLTGAGVPGGIVDGSGYLLQDPSVTALRAQGQTVPDRNVTLDINPATGTLAFSSPLFDVDRPADPLTVFNSSMSLGGGQNLIDATVFGSYHPFIYRVTRDGADDDCPSAFHVYTVDPTRVTVFWRRNYPVSSTPHFGRSALMHKSFTTSIHVAKSPITSVTSCVNAYNTGQAITYAADADALEDGFLGFDPDYVGRTVKVEYVSGDGNTYTEYHEVPGWSADTPIPVKTGGSEGHFVVKPEVYTVPDGYGDNTRAIRYWLFWTGFGSVYDLRVLNQNMPGTTPNAGPRTGRDPIIMQSSDVYTAVVSPKAGAPVREKNAASVSYDPT